MTKRAIEIAVGDTLKSGRKVIDVRTFPAKGEVWIELDDGSDEYFWTDDMVSVLK